MWKKWKLLNWAHRKKSKKKAAQHDLEIEWANERCRKKTNDWTSVWCAEAHTHKKKITITGMESRVVYYCASKMMFWSLIIAVFGRDIHIMYRINCTAISVVLLFSLSHLRSLLFHLKVSSTFSFAAIFNFTLFAQKKKLSIFTLTSFWICVFSFLPFESVRFCTRKPQQHFTIEKKRTSCMHFGTAMKLLTRSLERSFFCIIYIRVSKGENLIKQTQNYCDLDVDVELYILMQHCIAPLIFLLHHVIFICFPVLDLSLPHKDTWQRKKNNPINGRSNFSFVLIRFFRSCVQYWYAAAVIWRN